MPIGKFMGGNSIDTAIPKINIQQQQKRIEKRYQNQARDSFRGGHIVSLSDKKIVNTQHFENVRKLCNTLHNFRNTLQKQLQHFTNEQ